MFPVRYFAWRDSLSKLVTATVFALVLLFKSSALLAAGAGGNIYTPSYQYAGPQGSSIADEDIKGKDPMLATVFSVLPGVIIHGFGNYYAGDYAFGTRMLVLELVGAGVWAWGNHMLHKPWVWDEYFADESRAKKAGYWISAIGVTAVIISWLGDVATAHKAADTYNRDHQIQFHLEAMDSGGALKLSKHF